MPPKDTRNEAIIPQNFVDTGTVLGGEIRLRNAVEAAFLALGTAIPVFYLPLTLHLRIILCIVVSVPLAVFGVVGIGGDSLTEFAAHWLRFVRRRRVVTATPEGNRDVNRKRHLHFIDRRKYHVVYYEDETEIPAGAAAIPRKNDTPGRLIRSQTLYDLIPISRIQNGILQTTDGRYLKILEIEPINFMLRSPQEQHNVIYSFASVLKIAPVRMQFKSFSRKADVNSYLDKLRQDARSEKTFGCGASTRTIFALSGSLAPVIPSAAAFSSFSSTRRPPTSGTRRIRRSFPHWKPPPTAFAPIWGNAAIRWWSIPARTSFSLKSFTACSIDAVVWRAPYRTASRTC